MEAVPLLSCSKRMILCLVSTLAVYTLPQSVEADTAFSVIALESVSDEDALAESNGRFLLHFGEDFNPVAAERLIERLENEGLTVEAMRGGPSGAVHSYMYGNWHPQESYDESDTVKLEIILVEIAKRHGLAKVDD
ncbi:hypothetical protein [Algicella marina]|uniref:Uncharacterized protein n=1 Tax=Algicella marina TaxID=2683284 RepID=A0A6P1T2H3_9RHOB|nr:hypothetical protein [Algicella marina]QHQ35853.1 hypothetical protein GO499_12055 [Algicella marina]